jgi:hypothetical protein
MYIFHIRRVKSTSLVEAFWSVYFLDARVFDCHVKAVDGDTDP